MKKILASLLILVLFATPLVCGCGHEALADSSHQAAHADADHDHDKGQTDQDCHKATMQLPAQASVAKPGQKNNLQIDFVIADQKPVWVLALALARAIRGPPGADPPDPALPVYLITQRLRI